MNIRGELTSPRLYRFKGQHKMLTNLYKLTYAVIRSMDDGV